MTPLFFSSGLFLGWSLGANDTANIFGTAVATRMVRFYVAATIASIFIILGAVFGGGGTTETLGALGSVNALAGAFTVALSAAVAITWMTKLGLPVSTSQAIVGAIIGWNIFSGSPTDPKVLSMIASTWVFSVVLAAFFALILFKVCKMFLDQAKIHILRIDYYNRLLLIVVGAFGAYSLGANNIANVMGVFVPIQIFQDSTLLGFITITGREKLFLLGGLSISLGVFTYAKHVIYTVGNEIYRLTPITALIVVFSQSLVLFLFSSQDVEYWLISLGLPSFPLVPVSSSQAVVGAVIGISLAKAGGRGVNYKILGKIALGWIATPTLALLLCLPGLFIMQNVFEQTVKEPERYHLSKEVMEKLAETNITTVHIKGLLGQEYVGADNFRQHLLAVHHWTEGELFQIFSIAKIDVIKVNADILRSRDIRNFTPGELAATIKLDGRTFNHKWQLADALAAESTEWTLKENTKHNKPFNDQIIKKREILFNLFQQKAGGPSGRQ